MARTKQAVFIDLDGVLHESKQPLGVIMAQKLGKTAPLYPQVMPEIMETLKAYSEKKIDYDTMGRRMVKLYSRGVTGVLYPNLQKAAKEAADELIFAPGAKAFISGLKRQGYVPVLITLSPFEAAKEVGKRLGISEVIGTKISVKKGICIASRQPVLTSYGKAMKILGFSRKKGISLSRSRMMGDSIGDIGGMLAVRYPMAYKPHEKSLSEIARIKGWPVAQSLAEAKSHIKSSGLVSPKKRRRL